MATMTCARQVVTSYEMTQLLVLIEADKIFLNNLIQTPQVI